MFQKSKVLKSLNTSFITIFLTKLHHHYRLMYQNLSLNVQYGIA